MTNSPPARPHGAETASGTARASVTTWSSFNGDGHGLHEILRAPIDQSRLRFVYVVAAFAFIDVGVVVAARAIANPFWGISFVFLAAAVLATAICVLTYLRLDPGWVRWRTAVGVVAVAMLFYPFVWAGAAMASELAPDTRTAWAFAVTAGVGHLPLLSAFSLLPLLAVRYLGTSSFPWASWLVVGFGAAATTGFTLFRRDFEPLEAQALVDWPTGERITLIVNLAFLATVLLGPAAALWAAVRSTGAASRRLAAVALSALAGAALVMLCGAIPSSGTVVLFCALYAALVSVVVGGSHALSLPEREEVDAPRLEQLTAREAEVLRLLAEGLSNAGIASRLFVSQRTVDAHLRSVFTKLDLPDGPLENRRVHAALAWRDDLGERADAV